MGKGALEPHKPNIESLGEFFGLLYASFFILFQEAKLPLPVARSNLLHEREPHLLHEKLQGPKAPSHFEDGFAAHSAGDVLQFLQNDAAVTLGLGPLEEGSEVLVGKCPGLSAIVKTVESGFVPHKRAGVSFFPRVYSDSNCGSLLQSRTPSRHASVFHSTILFIYLLKISALAKIKITMEDLKKILSLKIKENEARRKIMEEETDHFMTKKIGTCIDIDLVDPWTEFSKRSGIAKSRILSCALRDFLAEHAPETGVERAYVLDTREKAGRLGGVAKRLNGEAAAAAAAGVES